MDAIRGILADQVSTLLIENATLRQRAGYVDRAQHVAPVATAPAVREFSGMTDREALRYTGTLSPERIERLIEQSEAVTYVLDTSEAFESACDVFPDEDFMEPVIDHLRDLIEELPETHQPQFVAVLRELETLNRETLQSAENGMEAHAKFSAALDMLA